MIVDVMADRASSARNEQHNLFLIITRRNLNNSHLWKIHRAPYDRYYKINLGWFSSACSMVR